MKIVSENGFAGLLLVFSLVLMKCDRKVQYYTAEDFPRIEKIDAHVHMNSQDPAFIQQAEADNFRLLTINTDYPDFPPVEKQMEFAVQLKKRYPNRLAFASTFKMTGWDEPNWQQKTNSHLDSTFEKGAVAVKIWKNIGMSFRNKNGELVMIDNPRFDGVLSHVRKKNIPVIGHQGEPRNCWLPVEEMTVNNDKEYFQDHPQYHMYLNPEMPSYEQQIAARDNMLLKNKDLVFVGAHLASLEWSVDTLAMFLDRFPGARVDLADRMCHIQFQSSLDREHVRKFLMNYQDRILYATDLIFPAENDTVDFRELAHKKWLQDWRYLTTADTMEAEEVNGKFTGLRLPSGVVDKIYRLNAEGTFAGAWK